MTKKVQRTVKDSAELKRLIETIRKSVRTYLSEDYSFVNEKEKQDDLTNDLFGDDSEAPAPEEQPSQQPVDTDKVSSTDSSPNSSDATQEEATLENVIDRLNVIRAGRSFKDDEVNAQMEKYFGDLKDAEKEALLAFLKGISQIVSGSVPGEQAAEPKDAPSNVEMTKNNHVKHVKPNVISKNTPSSTTPAASKEDTSSPSPVIPKKR